MQQVPSEIPDFVKPDFGTADIDHLKADIPKWFKWMSPASCTKWTEFLESGVSQLSNPQLEHQWPLDLMTSLSPSHVENRDLPPILLTSKNRSVL